MTLDHEDRYQTTGRHFYQTNYPRVRIESNRTETSSVICYSASQLLRPDQSLMQNKLNSGQYRWITPPDTAIIVPSSRVRIESSTVQALPKDDP